MKKKNEKIEKFQQMMCDYQEEYEISAGDSSENPWINNYKDSLFLATDMAESFADNIREAVYSAQYLGFVEGMRYALDVMDIAGKGDNKELIEKLLEIIESE